MLWGNPTGRRGGEVLFGTKESKSVNPGTLVWSDFEANTGGGYIDLHLKAIGPLPKREAKPKAGNGHGKGVPPWENVGRTYPYHNADGDLILEVVRTLNGEPRFLQRQPNGMTAAGAIKWRWNVKNIPGHDRLLYRLPELRAAPLDEIIYICEGEKDADRVHNAGLTATTNIGGAGKWRNDCAEEFRGRHCIVLQDNDKAGQDHAATVARSLIGIAASVKILLLPNLPPKGDVSDWLDAAHTLDELQRLAREAPEFVSDRIDTDNHDNRDNHGFLRVCGRFVAKSVLTNWVSPVVPDFFCNHRPQIVNNASSTKSSESRRSACLSRLSCLSLSKEGHHARQG
jgi:putative DNA primase/helicase